MNADIAIFSPLPPTKSGIADYAFEQLSYWRDRWNVAVVVGNSACKNLPVPEGVEVHQLKDWLANEKRDRATPRLYHIGNNPHHEFVFEEALNRPGVVVLHDFVLHHLIAELTLARGDKERYARFMEHDFGQLGRKIADQRNRYAFTDYQQFLMPLNGSIIERAVGLVTHSLWAHRRIRSRYPDKPVACIPHHYSPPESAVTARGRAGSRELLGMPKDRLSISSLGFITKPKQLELTIKALGTIRDRLPPFELWVAGEAEERESLEALLRACGIADVTRITGYLPLEQLQDVIQASDVIVNLRYPTAGETSGTLMRALGMGRCCIVFDYATFSDFPNDVAVKTALNIESTEQLEAALLRVGTAAQLRHSFEKRASAFVGERAKIEHCVESYTNFLSTINI